MKPSVKLSRRDFIGEIDGLLKNSHSSTRSNREGRPMATTPSHSNSVQRLILASSSPRRREILEAAGIPFDVVVAPVPEDRKSGESPEEFVCRIATEKAVAALHRLAARSTVNPISASPTSASDPTFDSNPILGADTVVVLGTRTLGKPGSADEVREMLRLLSGRQHRVLTGVCLLSPPAVWPCPLSALRKDVRVASTAVRFSQLTEDEIEEYVASGEPLDKAGAYGIQGLASKFIESIQGCYFNVVGLPVSLVYQMLKEFRSAAAEDASAV
jgi:septum formation protein